MEAWGELECTKSEWREALSHCEAELSVGRMVIVVDERKVRLIGPIADLHRIRLWCEGG